MLVDLLFFIVHWMIGIFSSIHIFIYSKSYDIYFITLWSFIVMHWVFINGECILTYLYKKRKDPKYVIGTNPSDMPDMKINNTFMYILFIIVNVMIFINMIVIFYRNKDLIPLYLSFTSILLILIYINLIRINNKKYNHLFGFILFTIAGSTYFTYLINYIS